MQTTVLKLSQNEADLASGDGDYVCSLAVPQQLRSGDTIAVAKAYLDTRTAEGTVELPTDTRCSVSALLYAQYIDQGGKVAAGGGSLPSVDNQPYLLCQNNAATPMEYIVSQDIDSDLHHGDRTWGGFTVVFGYRDINNQPQTWSADVGKKKGGGSHHFDVDLYTQPGTWAVQTDLGTWRSKLGAVVQQAKSLDEGTLPVTRTLVFTLKAGQYTPAQLSDEISRQLQTLAQPASYADYGQLSDSIFLLDSNSLAWSDTVVGSYKMVRGDGQAKLLYNGTDHYLIGASQVALDFDEVKQRFRFTYLHAPLYDASGNVIVKVVDESNNRYTTASRAGGVLLTDMQPSALWFDTMGFSPTQMCRYTTVTVGGNVRPQLTTSPDESTTAGLVSLGTFVQKNADFQKLPSAQNFTATASDTQPVTARTTFQANLQNGNKSHYLIELLGLPSHSLQLLGSQQQSFALRAIVSAYYSSSGYTSLDTATLSTVHQGEAASVTTLHVRILNPDGSLAALGPDNVVYLVVQSSSAATA
jgi:hypothetical protein